MFDALCTVAARAPGALYHVASAQKLHVAALTRLLYVAACLGLSACTSGTPNPNPRAALPLQSVPVDLPRYMGRWYVIANIPYFAERGFVASRAEWTLRADGRIDDVFVGRKGGFAEPERRYQFLDTVKTGSDGGEWSVRLFWPIHVTQLTLYVDPDYRYTLLGYPGKKLGWIFARQPQIDEEQYRALLARLDSMGYDTSLFRRVPQMPSQIGQPGFARPDGGD
ncbi:lipocalin family protein [Paraburkholderia bannensis]|uniref:lipocalin family protein n=1 Tax=Paraburkholderia bannensis TaxID=765414 RepID=UPI002ABD43C5|nr:lipocalin family protein [Paraburkholderia bannensis]